MSGKSIFSRATVIALAIVFGLTVYTVDADILDFIPAILNAQEASVDAGVTYVSRSSNFKKEVYIVPAGYQLVITKVIGFLRCSTTEDFDILIEDDMGVNDNYLYLRVKRSVDGEIREFNDVNFTVDQGVTVYIKSEPEAGGCNYTYWSGFLQPVN